MVYRSVSNTAPTNGQVLAWNGTAWAPTMSSASGSPTGTANGDLNGLIQTQQLMV